MAGYKISYKVLSQQEEELKTVARQMDDYASRLDAIRGKLGSDNMFSSIRQSLQKLSQQFGENRAILTLSSQVVAQCLEGYSGGEKTVVQKVDATRAHSRDFYKNPVTVASAAGTSAMGAPVLGAIDPGVADSGATASTTTAENLSAPVETNSTSGKSTGGMSAAAMGTIAAAGAAAGSGGLFGIQKLKSYLKQKDVSEPAESAVDTSEEDPEVLLARALKEVEKYQQPTKATDNTAVSPAPDTTLKFGTAQ